uniref:Uncharacterized protein n=1 Tax=Arundo donax TaxID=35708 RepID=A0A0A9CNC4_ARUDO
MDSGHQMPSNSTASLGTAEQFGVDSKVLQEAYEEQLQAQQDLDRPNNPSTRDTTDSSNYGDYKPDT